MLDKVAPRAGAYMHTSNGKKFWPLDPRPEDFDIEVIAHHLATRGRYNGATQHPEDPKRIFFSVAEHSVYVSWHVEYKQRRPDLALEALLHDGVSETYNGDLIRPLKYDPLFREPFKRVEELNERAGSLAFNLVYPFPPEIKIADEAVTTDEVNQIVPKDPNEEWESGKLHDDSKAAGFTIQMLTPYEAKLFFLERWQVVAERRNAFRPLPERFWP